MHDLYTKHHAWDSFQIPQYVENNLLMGSLSGQHELANHTNRKGNIKASDGEVVELNGLATSFRYHSASDIKSSSSGKSLIFGIFGVTIGLAPSKLRPQHPQPRPTWSHLFGQQWHCRSPEKLHMVLISASGERKLTQTIQKCQTHN